jgi:hypothetical protein
MIVMPECLTVFDILEFASMVIVQSVVRRSYPQGKDVLSLLAI